MNTHASKLWPHVVVRLLAWTAALVLITNVSWGLWAALGFDNPDNYPERGWVGITDLPDGRVLVVLEDRSTTRASYTTWINPPRPPGGSPSSVDEVLPSLFHRYCGVRGSLLSDARFEWCRFKLVGWPAPLLWVGAYSNDSVVTRFSASGVQIFECTSTDLDRLEGSFPMRPIWTGQAVYAGIWFAIMLLVLGPIGAIRRHIRHWRGRCEKCGYDLRGNVSGVCPECGAAARESTGKRREESGAA